MSNIGFNEKIDIKIDEIRLYKLNIFAERHFSFGTWTSRQHAFIKITAGSKNGWGENIMSVNNPDIDLVEWSQVLMELKGLTVNQAMQHVRSKVLIWQNRLSEMAEMALVDLSGKLLDKPALELLNLHGNTPVYGVFVILSDDVNFVQKQAKWAVQNHRARYIKVKLFGDLNLDTEIINAVRKEAGENTFLIGDVNGGYRMRGESTPLENIAQSLKQLAALGLDACEDPAYIDDEEWITLQDMVGGLSLIPDYPMRPACKAANTLKRGMGRIYNIHPGCTASIIDAVFLANKVKKIGAKLMIGDDSLIGRCSAWQQLAIGLGADWVEAVEKENDSTAFLSALTHIATMMNEDGSIGLKEDIKGFGMELDESKLAKSAVQTVNI